MLPTWVLLTLSQKTTDICHLAIPGKLVMQWLTNWRQPPRPHLQAANGTKIYWWINVCVNASAVPESCAHRTSQPIRSEVLLSSMSLAVISFTLKALHVTRKLGLKCGEMIPSPVYCTSSRLHDSCMNREASKLAEQAHVIIITTTSDTYML